MSCRAIMPLFLVRARLRIPCIADSTNAPGDTQRDDQREGASGDDDDQRDHDGQRETCAQGLFKQSGPHIRYYTVTGLV
jgi:hypothetical protein